MKKLNTFILGCAATLGSVCHTNAQTTKANVLDAASREAITTALSFSGMGAFVHTDKNGRFDLTSYQHDMKQMGYKVDSVKSKILNNPNHPETRGDTLLYVSSWKRGETGILQIEDILAHPKNSKTSEYTSNDLTISDIYYVDNTGDRCVYHMEKNDAHKPTVLAAQFLSTAKVIGFAQTDSASNNDFVQEGYNNSQRRYLLERFNEDGYYQLHDMKAKISAEGSDYIENGISGNRYSPMLGSFAIFYDVNDKKHKIEIPQL